MTEAALTVDLEFFDQTPAYRSATSTTSRTSVGLDGVRFLLDAFDSADAESTFFTVSSILPSQSDLIGEISSRGHEIASHTHTHRLLTDLSETEQKDELETSREQLAAVSGTDVEGFRAPAFDIPTSHFSLLEEAGYRYDSSVVPSRSIPGWYGGEHDVDRPCSADTVQENAPEKLRELPVSVMPGLQLPLTGTWLRFFGHQYTRVGMWLLARRGINPVLYVHPWELVDLPRVEGVPARVYWRTGRWMRQAVKAILQEPFEFVSAQELVGESR
jgi:hypothetical protein